MLKKILSKLKRKIFNLFNPEYFASGHFYSTIPSSLDIEKRYNYSSYDLNELSGIAIDSKEQVEILGKFKVFAEKNPFYSEEKKQRYFIDNNSFSYDDAPILHYFLRLLKPKRIIEIGSGNSSAVMLDTDENYLKNDIEFTFVDIDCTNLRAILSEKDFDKVQIIEKPIQEVNLAIFNKLKSGDLLFIDSSHVLKLGSDLQSIYYKILPILNKGVYIHFHDIRFPFDYPEGLAKRKIFWNEAYFLRAFLMYNNEFRVFFWLNYLLNTDNLEILERTNFLPLEQWDKRFNNNQKDYKQAGGSIYLIKQ